MCGNPSGILLGRSRCWAIILDVLSMPFLWWSRAILFFASAFLVAAAPSVLSAQLPDPKQQWRAASFVHHRLRWSQPRSCTSKYRDQESRCAWRTSYICSVAVVAYIWNIELQLPHVVWGLLGYSGFWLWNAPGATTACTFWTPIPPARWPRTSYFSQPRHVDPLELQNIAITPA